MSVHHLRGRFQPPKRWTSDELDAARREAEEQFRTERMQEPLQEYFNRFATVQQILETLMVTTSDLTRHDEQALTLLTRPDLLDGVRYLTGPPVRHGHSGSRLPFLRDPSDG